MCTCMYTCVYVYVYVVCIYVCIHMCMGMCVCVCMYAGADPEGFDHIRPNPPFCKALATTTFD